MQQQVEKHKSVVKPSKKSWKIWWQLLRPHTLTAAFVPVTIGTALALQASPFRPFLFLAMLLASILIQAATNMFNEYYDYERGLDNHESVGIGGAIVREGVHPHTVMKIAISFLTIAVLLGAYISMSSSWWIAVIGIICMAAGYFYTGGPKPIAYTPFGEIIAGLFMGFVIILISYYIQAGTVSMQSFMISFPISILVGTILLANNIRDLDGDKENGRQTVAILIGRESAITLLAWMFLVSYGWILFLILAHYSTPWLLLVLASAPKAYQATNGFKGKTLPKQMMPAMKATAQTNTQFGFLLAIGLLLNYWF